MPCNISRAQECVLFDGRGVVEVMIRTAQLISAYCALSLCILHRHLPTSFKHKAASLNW